MGSDYDLWVRDFRQNTLLDLEYIFLVQIQSFIVIVENKVIVIC